MLLRALWHPITGPPSYAGGTWGDMGTYEHLAFKTKSSSRSCAAAGEAFPNSGSAQVPQSFQLRADSPMSSGK